MASRERSVSGSLPFSRSLAAHSYVCSPQHSSRWNRQKQTQKADGGNASVADIQRSSILGCDLFRLPWSKGGPHRLFGRVPRHRFRLTRPIAFVAGQRLLVGEVQSTALVAHPRSIPRLLQHRCPFWLGRSRPPKARASWKRELASAFHHFATLALLDLIPESSRRQWKNAS